MSFIKLQTDKLYQTPDQIKDVYMLHCGDTPVADRDVQFLSDGDVAE